MKKIALVSAPWPLFSRPSIQLGTLKAYIRSQFPNLDVTAHHCYLDVAAGIGYPLYEAICKRTWLAESIYASLRYPERKRHIQAFFHRHAKSSQRLRKLDFDALTHRVEDISLKIIHRLDWPSFGLVGFSVCLCQFNASLFFVERIKRLAPSVPIVLGGSMISPVSAAKMLAAVPQIDYAVVGEGELPLAAIVQQLSQPLKSGHPTSEAGIVSRRSVPNPSSVARVQLPDLKRLPPPDYSDYFTDLNRLAPQHRFFPVLPVEMSRGCWWQSTPAGSCGKGCAFCNLNQQWEGYRAKSPRQVLEEVDRLTESRQTLSVAFVDNVVPRQSGKTVFKRLAGLPKDLHMFCELRANTSVSTLAAMKAAGVNQLQIGIEGLSTGLLKRMNKGTTAIQNMEIMKNCEGLGLTHQSNLILQFPGSTSDEMSETLEHIDFAEFFQPLRCVDFTLGYGSPVWQSFRQYGIKAVFNHPNWRALFPSAFYRAVPLMIQGYRGDRQKQRQLWNPVRRRVTAWATRYDALHRHGPSKPILGFRDGATFLIIRQRRLKGDPLTHRLVGSSREIYLYCQRHRSIHQILGKFSGLTTENIVSFLQMMVDKRLMFTERDRYLSLAVPLNPRRYP